MERVHHDLKFELKDDWWAEASMVGFVAPGPTYRVDSNAFPDRKVYKVRIEEVGPVHRNLSAGVFNDDKETGRSAKERVILILRGFQADVALPPVEVVKLPPGDPYRYKLVRARIACTVRWQQALLMFRRSTVLIGRLLISKVHSRIPALPLFSILSINVNNLHTTRGGM